MDSDCTRDMSIMQQQSTILEELEHSIADGEVSIQRLA